MQASPNPFENNLIISLPDESPVKVTITNNLGHIYETSDWTYEYGQLKINNQAHLFQGMYVINITTASGQFICKVQKR